MTVRLDRLLGITPDEADTLVGAIDVLEQLAGRRNQNLAPAVVDLRSQLRRFAKGSADATTQPSDVLDELLSSATGGWDTATTARELGITDAAVRKALREGRIDGYRHGNTWIVSARSVAEYQNRKGR